MDGLLAQPQGLVRILSDIKAHFSRSTGNPFPSNEWNRIGLPFKMEKLLVALGNYGSTRHADGTLTTGETFLLGAEQKGRQRV